MLASNYIVCGALLVRASLSLPSSGLEFDFFLAPTQPSRVRFNFMRLRDDDRSAESPESFVWCAALLAIVLLDSTIHLC